MFRLASLEVRKLVSYRPFWIIMGLYIGICTLSAWIVAHLSSFNPGTSMTIKTFLAYPNIWEGISWLMQFANILFTLMVVLHLTNQLELRMVRQHVIDGLSRTEVLLGQLMIAFSLAVFSALTVLALGAIFGLGTLGTAAVGTKGLITLGSLAAETFLHLAFVIFITLIFRRAVPTIIFLVFWHVALEPIGGYLLQQLVHPGIRDYLPFTVIDQLVPIPSFLGAAEPTMAQPLIYGLCAAYGALFLGLSWIKLQRSDL